MGKKRTFKVGQDILDIPIEKVDQFLVDVPDAKEVQSFTIGKDTVDIPIEKVDQFLVDVPDAKPLFEIDADTIPVPALTNRDSIPPSPPEPPADPNIPSVELDQDGNMSRTVQVDRKQRDAIISSAFKVPYDIRQNEVFGKRYVMGVSRRMGIPENVVDKIYKDAERDYKLYTEIKSNYDVGKGTDDDLYAMGKLLLNMGCYDEALQAFKKLEGNLMQQGIKEYQPGWRRDYIDQRQAPAFIGILNAVYSKGDMKEYERLLKIAEVKGIDLSGIPSVGDGDYFHQKPTDEKAGEYMNSIADAMMRLTGLPQAVELTKHGASKVADHFVRQFFPWGAKGVGETLNNYIGMLAGSIETVGAPVAYSTPLGAISFAAIAQLPPEAQEYLMPVSKIVNFAYDGAPPEAASNLAILGDVATMALLHVGAKNIKNMKMKVGADLVKEIEKISPEEVRSMFLDAEKRYKAAGENQQVYAEQVRERNAAVIDELKAIEDATPQPYNPEPAPESLRTVAEGVDVEYEGKIGKLDRGDDGTWYFDDGEGTPTQIPVEDKFNPTEKLSELGIQVLPEISKEKVARAVADAEQVGEVEYKGKKYFVSIDRVGKENPTGDLVFERTADGRLLNRFDSHPDPVFAGNRKLAIVNEYLRSKGLPERKSLIEPWKERPVNGIEEVAAVEPKTEPVTEGAVTPEVVAPEIELLTPETDANKVEGAVEVSGDEAPRVTEKVAEGSPAQVQPIAKEKRLTKKQQEAKAHKEKVRNSKMAIPVDFRHAVLQFVLGDNRGISLAGAKHNTGFGAKDFPPFTISKKGITIHQMWESMKTDPATSHLIPESDLDFANGVFDVLTSYGKRSDMYADLYRYTDESAWREMGFSSQHEYESAIAAKMEAMREGVDFGSIPEDVILYYDTYVDLLKDDVVDRMLRDLDEAAPKTEEEFNRFIEKYEEGTNTGTKESRIEGKTDGIKGEDLYEIAKEQQQRDIVANAEAELKKAQEDYQAAKEALDQKKKEIDKKIAEEQQQELFEAEAEKNPLEADIDVNAREAALKAEKDAFEQAKKNLQEAQGTRKQNVLKKIDEFEQWALNLPGIKDMSGGAEKAGIGAAEVVKGMTELVRKAVEAGFDIADAVAEAIDKYKKISPEFFKAVSEDAIREKFGVDEPAFAAANKATKKLRERIGIPQDAEFTSQNKRDMNEVIENAKKLKEEGVNPSELIDKVNYERYMLTPEEQQFLVNHEIDLFNERRELENKLANINPDEIERAKYVEMAQRVREIQVAQANVFNALERAGSEQSLVFRMRQLISRRDYSVENFERTYKSIWGKEPPSDLVEKVRQKSEQVTEAQNRVLELEAAQREAQLQAVIDDLRSQLEKEKSKPKGKSSLTKQEAERKQELKKKFAGVFNDITNIAATLADKEFYEYAKLVFKETVGDFKDFTQRLIDDLGPKVNDYAREIYDNVRKGSYKQPEMRNKRLWIDPQMLRDLVADGVDNHKDLTARALEIVKETFPEATERQVSEAISGYGKTRESNLPELDRKLNELKRDMKLALGLEDAKAGKGVLRSGYQPPKLTDDQRDMMRKIREELKNYPEDEASAQNKWASSLKKIKTTLENAIKDTQKRIDDLNAGRAVEKKEKKIIQLDDEAIELKEQLAELKKQLADIEGPRTVSDEQLVRQQIAAAERAMEEYERRTQEIRATGTYSTKPKRTVSSPELDLAKAEKDRAKEAYEQALKGSDAERIAATSRELSAATKRLQKIEAKVNQGDVSYAKRVVNAIVDQNNPLLKATKEKIKQQQEILKAMREASGEADRHAVELWKKRTQKRIDDLNARRVNKDFSENNRRVLPIDQEMIRMKAEETRAKYEYDVAVEIAKREGMSKAERLLEQIQDVYELPKSVMASLDLSAIGRQGAILGARHPLQYIGKHIPNMFKMMVSKDFYNQWHDQIVHTDDYISAKESGLFLNEPNAKLSAREELAASKIASKIPGVSASNRAYAGLLNMERMQAFSNFKTACLDAGITGTRLKKELKSYADFINLATGRGKFGNVLGKNMEVAVPLLNIFFFAPRFVLSRAQLMYRVSTGFYTYSPKARIEAYKAMGSWAASIGSTLFLLNKIAGVQVGTDPTSTDFGKIIVGNQRYDLFAGFQQIYVLLNRIRKGYETSTKGEQKDVTVADLTGRFLRSKFSPQASYGYEAMKGRTMGGEKFDPVQGIIDRIQPLIIKDLREIAKVEDTKTAAINMLPMALGVAVSTIDNDKIKRESGLDDKVLDLMNKAGYYPKQTFDQEVYVNGQPYEISNEELEQIRKLRNKRAGEIINRWNQNGRLSGRKKAILEEMWNDAYSDALRMAYDKVLPNGWTNKKPEEADADMIIK